MSTDVVIPVPEKRLLSLLPFAVFLGIFLGTGIVLTLQGQDLMHYWAGLVVLGLGWNFLFVSGTVLLPQSYREQERFKVQGFNDFFVFGFQAFASLSSGVVIYTLGWNTLVVIALPFLLLQLGVMFIWKIKAAK